MKIPCEDCIVFPMCKARYVTIFESERHLLYHSIIHNCKLVEKWFWGNSNLSVIEKLFEVKRW